MGSVPISLSHVDVASIKASLRGRVELLEVSEKKKLLRISTPSGRICRQLLAVSAGHQQVLRFNYLESMESRTRTVNCLLFFGNYFRDQRKKA